METFLQWVNDYGYLAIFLMLFLGIVGLPIPDETLLTFAGYMVFTGRLHFIPTVLTAFAGTVCGITTSYLLGRLLGMFALKKYGRYIRITEERLDRCHRWYQRVGKWSLTFGYFIPGIRHFTALVAGSSKLEYRMFAMFAYSGGFCWSLLFICLGYFLGEGWKESSPETRRYVLGIFAVVAAGVFIGVVIHQRKRIFGGGETTAPTKPQEENATHER